MTKGSSKGMSKYSILRDYHLNTSNNRMGQFLSKFNISRVVDGYDEEHQLGWNDVPETLRWKFTIYESEVKGHFLLYADAISFKSGYLKKTELLTPREIELVSKNLEEDIVKSSIMVEGLELLGVSVSIIGILIKLYKQLKSNN